MKVAQYALVLGVVCLVAALAVAGTFVVTREPIRAAETANRLKAQGDAIGRPGDASLKFRALNPEAAEADQVLEAQEADGKVVGLLAAGEAQGYGRKIKVMVGMDAAAQKIFGVTIVSQSETPGLGTRVAEVRSSKTWLTVLSGRSGAEKEEKMPWFLAEFAGRTIDKLTLTKAANGMQGITGATVSPTKADDGIQGITGATVSSRAVLGAVRNAVERIQKARALPKPGKDAGITPQEDVGSAGNHGPGVGPHKKE